MLQDIFRWDILKNKGRYHSSKKPRKEYKIVKDDAQLITIGEPQGLHVGEGLLSNRELDRGY